MTRLIPGTKNLVSIALLTLVIWQWGQAGWILAKAEVAQWLIADAWQQSLTNQSVHKPWQWADTWPVARLQSPAHNIDSYVLNGDRGQALAFGPGHNSSSRLPGEGTSVIGGHKDTHFRFLKQVQTGELLRVQTQHGNWLTYKIDGKQVIDVRLHPLRTALDEQRLILVTCYPFDSLDAGGPLRLLVHASLVEEERDEPTFAAIKSYDTINQRASQ